MTDYMFITPVPFDKFWEKLPDGLTEVVTSKTDVTHRCLTDGQNYLWTNDDGKTTEMTRYGRNNVDQMIEVLEAFHGVEIIDEYDERYDALMGWV